MLGGSLKAYTWPRGTIQFSIRGRLDGLPNTDFPSSGLAPTPETGLVCQLEGAEGKAIPPARLDSRFEIVRLALLAPEVALSTRTHDYSYDGRNQP